MFEPRAPLTSWKTSMSSGLISSDSMSKVISKFSRSAAMKMFRKR